MTTRRRFTNNTTTLVPKSYTAGVDQGTVEGTYANDGLAPISGELQLYNYAGTTYIVTPPGTGNAHFVPLNATNTPTTHHSVTVPSNGQTTYTLPSAPTDPAKAQLSYTGNVMHYADHFSIAGNTLTLSFPSVPIFAGDRFQLWYQ